MKWGRLLVLVLTLGGTGCKDGMVKGEAGEPGERTLKAELEEIGIWKAGMLKGLEKIAEAKGENEALFGLTDEVKGVIAWAPQGGRALTMRAFCHTATVSGHPEAVVQGCLDKGGVFGPKEGWGGAGCQSEALRPQLRQAIEGGLEEDREALFKTSLELLRCHERRETLAEVSSLTLEGRMGLALGLLAHQEGFKTRVLPRAEEVEHTAARLEAQARALEAKRGQE